MSWQDLHSIAELPIGQRSAGSGHIAKNVLGLVDADLATVASAKAVADAKVLLGSICDAPIGNQCSRGFTMASNEGCTFGSTFTAFFASGPDFNHQQRAITG